MTLIAFKDNIMAADGLEIVGGRKEPVGFLKIWRAPDGALCAGTGESGDCYAFGTWFIGGRLRDEPEPVFSQTGDDEPQFLIATPGEWPLWRKTGAGGRFPVRAPYAMGEPAATNFCLGAMRAGMSAPDAVAFTIAHYVWIGGSVQVEELRPHTELAEADSHYRGRCRPARGVSAGARGSNI